MLSSVIVLFSSSSFIACEARVEVAATVAGRDWPTSPGRVDEDAEEDDDDDVVVTAGLGVDDAELDEGSADGDDDDDDEEDDEPPGLNFTRQL